MGNLRSAVEQLQMAVRVNDGDFRDLLVAEGRLREIRGSMSADGQASEKQKKKPRRSWAAR